MKLSVFYKVLLTIVLITFANISYATNTASDEAERLITLHIQAIGGADALMKMQSISRYGRITFYEQNGAKENFCYHTDIIYSNKLREQIKGKQIEYDRGTDGTSFWLWTGSQYEFTKDKQLIDYMLNTAERANRDMLWLKKESDNFEVVSIPPSWAPINSQCIQEIKTKNSAKRAYCFDTSTGLLNALGSAEEYRLESDWREIGNIKLPFRLTHYQNGVMIYEVQLDYADLNKEIPDSQFTKPDLPQLSC
jgi:hypothetical protein